MLTGQPARMELNMGRETETNEAGMERPRKRPKMRIIAMVRYNRLTCIVLWNDNERSEQKSRFHEKGIFCCVLAWRLGYLLRRTLHSFWFIYIINRRAKNVVCCCCYTRRANKQTERNKSNNNWPGKEEMHDRKINVSLYGHIAVCRYIIVLAMAFLVVILSPSLILISLFFASTWLPFGIFDCCCCYFIVVLRSIKLSTDVLWVTQQQIRDYTHR